MSLVAKWSFESGAMNTDSVGGNTLSAAGSPAESTSDYVEGSCSSSHTATDYRYLLQANMAAGFPFKVGSSGNFSVLHSFKIATVDVTTSRYLFRILSTPNSMIWWVRSAAGNLSIASSYDGTNVNLALSHGSYINVENWYGVLISWNATTKEIIMHVYDIHTGQVVGTDVSTTWAAGIYRSANFYSSFFIGTGKLDNFQVYDSVVSPASADAIFSAPFKYISATDNISLSENIVRTMSLGGVSVKDTISLVGAIGVSNLTLFGSAVETIAVTDVRGVSNLELFGSAIDSVSVGESIGLLSELTINLNETISTVEITTAVLSDLEISKNETVSVTESIEFNFIVCVCVEVFEVVSVTEELTTTASGLSISTTEVINLTEFIQGTLGALEVSRIETVLVSELASGEITFPEVIISSFEQVVVSEVIYTFPSELGLSLYDSISVSEYISFLFSGLSLSKGTIRIESEALSFSTFGESLSMSITSEV